ncbi:hypothetical protein MHU86_13877 [Fragilaria crotonensis]|nr:hypothetical protein MHU86_13877 [Fragilaria crotonensis]
MPPSIHLTQLSPAPAKEARRKASTTSRGKDREKQREHHETTAPSPPNPTPLAATDGAIFPITNSSSLYGGAGMYGGGMYGGGLYGGDYRDEYAGNTASPETASAMLDHALKTYTEMRRLDASRNESESEDKKEKTKIASFEVDDSHGCHLCGIPSSEISLAKA